MKTSPEAVSGSTETNTTLIFHTKFAKEVDLLCDTFGIVNRSLDGLLAFTQPWAKGDHYDPQVTLDLSEEQTEAMLHIAEAANMIEEVPMPTLSLDRIVLLGGEQPSNQQRVDWLQNQLQDGRAQLAADGCIVVLGGNRTLKGREIYSLGSGIRRIDEPDPWVSTMLRNEMSEVLTEDAGLRVAMLASLGKMVLSQMHLRLGTANDRELVKHRIFKTGSGQVIALNAAAQVRPLGAARHTTESSIKEWLQTDTALTGKETVVLVSSNPYILRTARNFHKTIAEAYPDMKTYTCGPAAIDDHLLVRRVMGEITRNFYEDSQVLASGD